MSRLTWLVTASVLLLSSCAPIAVTTSPLGGANGRLDPSDPQLDSGEYYETYSFAGRSGDLLTISLTSTEIDPYLMVLDPEGEKVAEVDDSAGHGYDVLVTVSLDSPGSYTIVVTSAFPGEVGAFSLDLSTGSRISPTSPAPSDGWVEGGEA